MFFAFFALITAFPLDVPKYSLMMIFQSGDSVSCNQVKQNIETSKYKFQEECRNIPESDFDNYFGCQVLFNFQDFFCSNSLNDFSNYISKVSSQSKLLFIYSELTTDYTIDLRNIPSKIDVEITCGMPGTNLKILDDSNLTSHRILNTLKKLTNNKFPLPFQSSNLKNPKVTGLKLGLVGDIKDKVGSLSLSTNFQEFEITESDLEIDSFSLVFNDRYSEDGKKIVISTNSRNIRTKNLYVDPIFHYALSELKSPNFVSVESYMLYFPQWFVDLVKDVREFQIGFNTNQWELQWKMSQENWESLFAYEDKPGPHPANYISYTKAKMFGILSPFTAFDLKMISSTLPQGQSANIRDNNNDLVPSDEIYSLFRNPNQFIHFTFPSLISITNSGAWSSVSKDSLPNVYLTFNTDKTQTQISSELDSLGVITKGDPINPAPENPDDDDTNIGMIVGIVVGCVVVIAVIIIVVIVVIRKKKANQNSADQSQA